MKLSTDLERSRDRGSILECRKCVFFLEQGSQKLFGFGQADICGIEDDPTLVFEAHSACVACSN